LLAHQEEVYDKLSNKSTLKTDKSFEKIHPNMVQQYDETVINIDTSLPNIDANKYTSLQMINT